MEYDVSCSSPKDIFDDLGIYGLGKHNKVAILASLLTGDPALLIGGPGCAKTELLSMIGAALRERTKEVQETEKDAELFKYRIYDSSKMNWEDLVGFPDIKKITEEKEIDFIDTGTTIWGAHLVVFDELNRCREDRQSNLFEVIRSRTLHGRPTGTKFVFGSMNPYGDTGTEIMSDALVDRFMFYIHFESFDDIPDSERIRIIQRIGHFDAVGMKAWSKSSYQLDLDEGAINRHLANAGRILKEMMKDGIQVYTKLEEDYSSKVAQIVNRVANHLHTEVFSGKNTPSISGRRAAMAYRGILSYRAAEHILSTKGMDSLGSMESAIVDALYLCLPHGVSGSLKEEDIQKARAIVRDTTHRYWKQLTSTESSELGIPYDVLYELYTTKDPFRQIDILLSYPIDKLKNNERLETDAIWSKLSELGDNKENIGKILYLLSATTDTIPDHVSVKDYKDALIHSSGKSTFECTLADHFVDCKEELESIYESIKESPVVSHIFEQAITYYNNLPSKTVTREDTYVALGNIRSMSVKLRRRLEAKD